MKFLQKLGKALMLPVACLPLCGLLMGIGYALCPVSMQGGDVKGAAALIGLFLVKAGAALIDNMALLFVIGVGVGLSEDNMPIGMHIIGNDFEEAKMYQLASFIEQKLNLDLIPGGEK